MVAEAMVVVVATAVEAMALVAAAVADAVSASQRQWE
jgi:hypothetical protein